MRNWLKGLMLSIVAALGVSTAFAQEPTDLAGVITSLKDDATGNAITVMVAAGGIFLLVWGVGFLLNTIKRRARSA